MVEEPSAFDPTVRSQLELTVKTLTREFDGVVDPEIVGSIVEQSARQLAQGRVAEFVPLLAQRYARERLRALASTRGDLHEDELQVLFVSLLGSGRAQIGAALLSRTTDESVAVHSAGSQAGVTIDPNVQVAMREVGFDLSDEFTRPLSPEVLADADIVVTMGRSVGQVEIPSSARHVDWRVGDPAGAELAEVRRVRDDIERRVTALAGELQDQLARAGLR